jgi:hypothetical protein
LTDQRSLIHLAEDSPKHATKGSNCWGCNTKSHTRKD